MMKVFAIVAVLAAAATVSDARLKGKECEVCIKMVEKLEAKMKEEKIDNSKNEKIEDAFRDLCKTAKGRDERFCYYTGGAKTSATGMLQAISKPLGRFLPATKVCEGLKKKDAQICDLIYDVPIDLKTLDFKKSRVKVLKKILNDQFDDKCNGCLEKDDYIKKIKSYMKDEL